MYARIRGHLMMRMGMRMRMKMRLSVRNMNLIKACMLPVDTVPVDTFIRIS